MEEVSYHNITRCHKPEDLDLKHHRHRSLKTRMSKNISHKECRTLSGLSLYYVQLFLRVTVSEQTTEV